MAPALVADTQLDSPPPPAKPAGAPPPAGAEADRAATTPESTATATAPEPGVVKAKNVNVRGRAAINSEIVTRLREGDPVMILEEVTLKKPRVDEPARWYKIAMPTNTFVWVHADFVDRATKAVTASRLNLRSGPGENYSVVGRIEKGTVVKELETKGNWIKIEPPDRSYAFVAAHLIERQPVAPVIAATTPPAPVPPPEPAPAPVETKVVEPPPPAPAEPPMEPPPTVAETTPPAPAEGPKPVEPVITTPPDLPSGPIELAEPPEEIKRTVIREGLVKRSVSIQAPTYFVLSSLDNKKTLNYLYSPSANIALKDFFGKRIIVTGEEGLDERWPNTPVLTVETLQEVP